MPNFNVFAFIPAHISQMAEVNLISCVAYSSWWTAIKEKWCALEEGYAFMKIVFSFFLSIYIQCGTIDNICIPNGLKCPLNYLVTVHQYIQKFVEMY